jgi:hypothetical protein
MGITPSERLSVCQPAERVDKVLRLTRDTQGTQRIWFRQDYRGWLLRAVAFCAPYQEGINKLPRGLRDC